MSERLRLLLERAGAGYRLRDAASGEVVRWEDPRVTVVPVAGVSFRNETLADPSFEPGRPLALVPEPGNEHDPNAVAVWNEDRTLQLGYVPREVAPTVSPGQQAISIWRSEGGLRVLIVPANAWVGRPR
ncbi:MAG: HIRAN domain-containing protein [Actinomycetota bacterium]